MIKQCRTKSQESSRDRYFFWLPWADCLECHHLARAGHQGIKPSHPGFTKGTCCLSNLISFCGKVTHLVDEGKAVDLLYLDLSKAFDTISHSIVLENLAARGWGGCSVCWVKNWLQCWDQSCLMSVPMTWTRASSAPSAPLQVTPSWAAVLMCWRVGRFCSGTGCEM